MKENKKFRGTTVEYVQLHQWVHRNLGTPKQCSFCKTQDFRIEWANISQEYRKDILDWIPLCTPCHRRFDLTTHWRWVDEWYKFCNSCQRFLLAENSFYKRKTKQKNGNSQAVYTVWCKICTAQNLKELSSHLTKRTNN